MSHFRIEEQLDLPRLTGTLRAFSNVSKKYTSLDPATERNLIRKRRELELALSSAEAAVDNDSSISSSVKGSENKVSVDWADLTMKLVPNRADRKYEKLKALLDKLRVNVAKQLLNEDFNDARILNEAAMSIMQLFYEHYDTSATLAATSSHFQNLDKLSKKLKEKFGQFQRNLFDHCREVMEAVFSELGQLEQITFLDEIFGSSRIELVRRQSSSMDSSHLTYKQSSIFGENIKFYSIYEKKLLVKASSGDDEDLSSSEDECDYEEEENDEYFLDSETAAAAAAQFKFNFPTDSTKEASGAAAALDCAKYLEWTQSLSSDLATIVYEILAKKASGDAEIQNELVELLGFERLELVEYLCTNRIEIVNAYNRNKKGKQLL